MTSRRLWNRDQATFITSNLKQSLTRTFIIDFQAVVWVTPLPRSIYSLVEAEEEQEAMANSSGGTNRYDNHSNGSRRLVDLQKV